MTDAIEPTELENAAAGPAGARPRVGAGLAAATLALVCWGWPAIIAKALPIDAIPLVFFRGWLGVAFAFGVLFARGRRMTLRTLRVSMWGGIALGFDLVFFFTAIKLTTIANTMIIGALQPALLVFAAPILFKERLRWPDVATAAVAMSGVALVIFGASGLSSWSPRGDGFAVLTLIAWTAYLAASKKARQSIRSTDFTAAVILIATVMTTPLVFLFDLPLAMPSPIHWLGLAAMAIFGWCGHVLMNWALGHIPLWVGGTSSLALPVIATGLAAVFLGEPVLPLQILGMAIALGSLAVVALRATRVMGPGDG